MKREFGRNREPPYRGVFRYTLNDIRAAFKASDWAYAPVATTCEQLLGDSKNTLVQLATEAHLTVLCQIMESGNTQAWAPEQVAASGPFIQSGVGESVKSALPQGPYSSNRLRSVIPGAPTSLSPT